jgi:hypothetical protein
VSQNLAALLETQKTGEALTAALEALNKELDKKEYQFTLYFNISHPIDHLYAASNQLLHHHQLSMSCLRELTASLGLLQIEVPLSISNEEEEFLKKLFFCRVSRPYCGISCSACRMR